MQCPKCSYAASDLKFGEPPKCPQCGAYVHKVAPAGTAFQKSAENLPRSVVRSNSKMRLFALAALGVLAIAFGWYFINGEMQKREVNSSAEREVGLVSAHAGQIIDAIKSPSSMTFGEFFRKTQASVTEIDSAMLRVAMLKPSTKESKMASEYMKVAQELVRASDQYMRAMFEYSNAKDRVEQAERDEQSENSYTRESAGRRKLEALNDSLATLTKIKESQQNLSAIAESLGGLADEMPFDADSLVGRDRLVFFNTK